MHSRNLLNHVRLRYLVLSVLIAASCGLAVTELCGKGPLHDLAPPPNVLNYPCLPKRDTWGYYAPKWRRWPGAPTIGVEPPEEEEVDLPPIDRPSPLEEDVRVPTPATPAVPFGAGPAPAAEAPPAAGPGAPLLPREPQPGGPLPGGPAPGGPLPGGAEPGLNGGLPSAPLPTTPVPGSGLPGDAAPLPGGATPQPTPAPSPDGFNPFDGVEGDLSRFGDDPPPPLPASLRSARRNRDAQRAAERRAGERQTFAGVSRLPGTGAAEDSPGTYPVQQTSATVWATGDADIRPVDPNAGRVQQAIHHEPAE